MYRRQTFARTPPNTILSSLTPVALLSPLASTYAAYTACLAYLVTPWIARCGAADCVGPTVRAWAAFCSPHLPTHSRTPHPFTLFVVSAHDCCTPCLSLTPFRCEDSVADGGDDRTAQACARQQGLRLLRRILRPGQQGRQGRGGRARRLSQQELMCSFALMVSSCSVWCFGWLASFHGKSMSLPLFECVS